MVFRKTYLKVGFSLGVIFAVIALLSLVAGELFHQRTWPYVFSKILSFLIILPTAVGNIISLGLAKLLGLLKSPPIDYCRNLGLRYPCMRLATNYFKWRVLDQFYITHFFTFLSSFVIFGLWGTVIGLIKEFLVKREGKGYRFLYFFTPIFLIALIIVIPFLVATFLLLSSFS